MERAHYGSGSLCRVNECVLYSDKSGVLDFSSGEGGF